MTADDFSTGLNIVPLRANRPILSSIAYEDSHPWRGLYKPREPPPDLSSKEPSTKTPPVAYERDNQLDRPLTDSTRGAEVANTRPVEWHETIRLCDVEAFRKNSAEKARESANLNPVNALTTSISRLSTASSDIRPVIYRYVDVIKNGFALLEAIHFELFMPDRPDLRFLALKFSSIPSGTVEGDLFHVHDSDLLYYPSFAVKLGQVYPVVWEVKQSSKIDFDTNRCEEAMVYVEGKNKTERGVVTAISDVFEHEISIRETLFRDQESLSEHSLVRVRIGKLHTANLHPVEPPLDPPLLSAEESFRKFGLEFDPRSEYLKRVEGVRSSSQRSGYAVSAVRAMDAPEAERIRDRLDEFTTYGQDGDLKLMRELFVLGSRFRGFASNGAKSDDAGETKIDEGVVLKTIQDEALGHLETCRSLLDCIYGRSGSRSASGAAADVEPLCVSFKDGTSLQLNPAQSRAVRLYADADGPRVFCILAPPGSGKTTVAAAMAAEVGRRIPAQDGVRGSKSKKIESCPYYSCVQLLLSVQNVAVDNMGAALKKMDYGGGDVYNMKSTKRLDPNEPAPYDFFDQMSIAELKKWKNGTVQLSKEALRNLCYNSQENRNRRNNTEQEEMEEIITYKRREYEKKVYPKIILSTVEMVLQKMYTESKLVSYLGNVGRIIIDEASLLTEATLFAIIRRFPEARIVLIGDDKQLPPFMYDPNMLGHELAGRPALSVAMKTGKVPLVELNEVYRAPPSLVAPYNRLAYDGRLISKKAVERHPLSAAGLIDTGRPQLLLIDVNGRQEANEYNMSLTNTEELKTLVRLLHMFRREQAKDIMIICLYKEQKKRLQDLFDMVYYAGANQENKYNVLTVDSAQGKEAPIVILMTTRTNRATDFFGSFERCNVSISRQQKALIILGKADLLSKNEPWSTVVNGDDFTWIRDKDI